MICYLFDLFLALLYLLVAFSSGWGCWQDEDHIGRCSRVSRSCHPLLAATRTIQKVLSLYKQQMFRVH